MVTVRGQAHTLEGLAAGLLLVGSLVFAMQVTAVTPLSASTSNQHIENQQAATARGVLATAAEDGSLKRAMLYWHPVNDRFRDSGVKGYYANDEEVRGLAFGRSLLDAFASRGLAFNVYVDYHADSGVSRTRFIYHGAPSDNAVAVSTTVTLYDDDPLFRDADGDGFAEPTADDVTNAATFYASDASPSTGLFNVVRVEVIVWRM